MPNWGELLKNINNGNPLDVERRKYLKILHEYTGRNVIAYYSGFLQKPGIIDEAHNILSDMSTRESEEWKDYRLESFEEIIKEGRKFGVFLTIASQRPSDISDTIISQLHNYFIHRLVNEEDLRKIYRTVAFADKASNDMIPILPAGGCLVSGLSTNFPVLVQIDILPSANRPKSENVDINKAWLEQAD